MTVAVAGLFSGIGGLELAFRNAGFESCLLVERDPVAGAVLAARFPGAPLASDVADVERLPTEAKIVTAGFPCQNLSMAGDKSGIGGAKSGVVAHMFRLLADSRVETVVVENVYFMLQLDKGAAMTSLVGEFERLGFAWAYRILDTMGFGLPQRRRRVFLVASKSVDPTSVLFADAAPERSADPHPTLVDPIGFYWTEGRSGVGFTRDGVPPLKVGSALGIPSAPAVLFPDGRVMTPSLAAGERLQGFPTGWTGGETSRRAAGWRLVGNAVSVPVAAWVAERLARPGPALRSEGQALRAGDRWPGAAWNLGPGRFGTDIAERPVDAKRPSITTFVDSDWSMLSDKALDGFIRRAVEGGLRMPAGFLDALRAAERKPARRTMPPPEAEPAARKVRVPKAGEGTASVKAPGNRHVGS